MEKKWTMAPNGDFETGSCSDSRQRSGHGHVSGISRLPLPPGRPFPRFATGTRLRFHRVRMGIFPSAHPGSGLGTDAPGRAPMRKAGNFRQLGKYP